MNFLRFCCCRSAIIKRQICHVIVLYILVFCLILPPICYRLPFSVYYSQKLYLWNLSPSVYARQVNDERIAKAVEFFVSESVSARLQDESLLHIGNLSSGSNTTNVRTTVAFVTTRRTRSLHPTEEYSPRYLLQTVAAVVRENQPSTRILICNMDPEPSAHTDAVYLSEFFSMVSRYGDDEVSVPHGKHEKEKQDYVYCLKKSLQTNPRYVLMLQDDALVVPGSLQVLDYVVRTKVERTRHGWDFTPNNDTRKLLKLHTPEYIQRDFHTVKPKRIAANLAELLGYGLFGGLCYDYYISFLLRPHLLELRRVSKYLSVMLDANDCCLPATLLPTAAARELVSFLEGETCGPGYPLDTAVDDFVSSKGYRQFAVEPNLFRHIGMYSTLHGGENTYLKHFVK
ncbi:post-GPI attachment to proteins factor 4-like [Branchiostoma floridae]|uniref:Post-GPI attachment to proteins factor 4-like n=1 Tax=Branchiostoma floridae TaxID=7739 RepID=A0A9J7HWB9_BRAFL|nr:post-GPI attachment to proteins factor 4-like [Branchiostoma floridae]